MSNKMYTVSRVNAFNPKDPGQFFHAVDDLGSFPSKEKAEAFAKENMTEDGWWLFSKSDETSVYKLGRTQELVIESIYVAE